MCKKINHLSYYKNIKKVIIKLMNIVVIGVGYVGLVTGLSLVKLGNKITFLDTDLSKIQMLNQKKPTFDEPELLDYLTNDKTAKNATFCHSYDDIRWNDADIVLICVQTPVDENGELDSNFIKKVFSSLNGKVANNTTVCIKSTIHPSALQKVLNEINYNFKDLVFNPEFLREGSAFYDFFNTDRIIIGSENLEKSQIIANLYEELESEIIFTDPISSQLIKYLSNAYLPLRLSFVNEASRLIDSLNANQSDVLKGVGLDSRIGDQYFRPSPGWGGSCFPKDVIEIQQIAKENNLDLPVIQSISNSNSEHLLWFSKKLKQIMNINNLQKIILLGAAFKENTDDTRYSPTFEIYNILKKENENVEIYDENMTLDNKYNQIFSFEENALYVEMYPMGNKVKNQMVGLKNIVYFRFWDS
tara:strand:- start:222 stop:1469 length:1248 start_codon:yes stop_codon:yes gene_type:complete